MITLQTGSLSAVLAISLLAPSSPGVPTPHSEPARFEAQPSAERDARLSQLLQLHGVAAGSLGLRRALPATADACCEQDTAQASASARVEAGVPR